VAGRRIVHNDAASEIGKQMTLRQFLFDNFGWDIYDWSIDDIRF
jgi:hypothetical protein